MAEAPNSELEPSTPNGLPERVQRYAADIEKVVTQVGEHGDYEMKRSCSLDTIEGRIEFVKDVQSIATSRISTEKFLIIGERSTVSIPSRMPKSSTTPEFVSC
jgi:hypothetical protein